MKKYQLILILTLVVLFFIGCTFIGDEELYNNTNDNLLVITTTLIDGKAHLKTNAVQSGQTIVLGVPSKLEIHRRGEVWHYDIKWIPYEFYRPIGGNRRRARLQIQEDGAIYVLSPGSTGSVTNFPTQPLDYPIRPK